jgi:histidine ammonia-lyase
MKTITLDGKRLGFGDVRSILREKTRLRIAPAALARVRKSRAVLEKVLADGRTIYGVNTGVGKLAETRIYTARAEELQKNLLLSHSTGVGEPIRETGLLIALRANTLLGGLSGVTPGLVNHLVGMFNRGERPGIREQGSVGASGDLAPLAELGCAMLKGKRPYRFRAKEALSLINGTQFTAAIFGRVLVDMEDLLTLADLAGAMSLEALRGSLKPFDRRFHEARPHPGQSASAGNFRKLLAKSRVLESHRNCAKVQDAYSLRCIPQVHGAARDAFGLARDVFVREINSVTDNPIVCPNGAILSGGNFHGMPLAIMADALSLALVSLANIAERRIERMTNPDLSDLPAFLVKESGLNSGYMMVQVTAAALAAECRSDAMPASVHSIPTGGSREDHVPMAPIAARKCGRILDNVRTILLLEILCAAQGLDFLKPLKPGRGVHAAHRFVRRSVPHLARDRYVQRDVRRVTRPDLVPGLLKSAERAAGALA